MGCPACVYDPWEPEAVCPSCGELPAVTQVDYEHLDWCGTSQLLRDERARQERMNDPDYVPWHTDEGIDWYDQRETKVKKEKKIKTIDPVVAEPPEEEGGELKTSWSAWMHNWGYALLGILLWLAPFSFVAGLAALYGQIAGFWLSVGYGATIVYAINRWGYHDDKGKVWVPVAALLTVVVFGSGGFGDKNCGDFTRWRDSQNFYDAVGWFRSHHLDGDADGRVCEVQRRQEIEEGLLNPDGSES